MPHAGKGPFSPEEQQRLGIDVFGLHPEINMGGIDPDIVACLFDPDCARRMQDAVGGDTATSSIGGDTATSSITDTTISASGKSSKVSTTITDVDEVTDVARRVFFDIPTPEQFLDNFENAFAGFASSMKDAGLGDTDLRAMLDPSTGFIQSMFSEYMGKIAQRAQAGEELYELAGLTGETKQVGQREGQVIETETTRLTVTEAEEILRKSGQEITTSAVESIIKESGKVSAAESKTTTAISEAQDAISKSTVKTTATAKEITTENLFSRPGVARVFKFSPTDFLIEKFDAEEISDVSVGMLSTLIKANAPLRRRQTGAVAVSARRT